MPFIDYFPSDYQLLWMVFFATAGFIVWRVYLRNRDK